MRSTVLILVFSLLAGCASRPPPVPRDHAWALPWGAVDPRTGLTVGLNADLGNAGAGHLPPDLDGDGRPNYTLLVISGGGAKGAFGAGVLKGWSAQGGRPPFTVVTGVSTGALMATWAFLGSRYDRLLERFYTQTTDERIFRHRGLLFAPFIDSLLDTTPLRRTIAAAIDQQILEEVADEYRKGRRLYVASTDLDANRLVVWDLGGIAASGHPDRLERYREALRASASIPVAFPPVYFPVEVDGRVYGQMHVDGGTVANFFLTGFILDRQRKLAPPGIERSEVEVDIYLLMNSHLEPQPPAEPVSPRLIAIATASGWATSWSAQTNQLVRAYRAARGMKVGFHLAGIPGDYGGPMPTASFDPREMAGLFRYGESLVQSASFWLSEPPGINWRERLE